MEERLRVVIVDDDEVQLAFATEVLEGEGFDVRTFSDAQRALDHCASEAPSLVISDVLMPGLGGFELHARYLRRFPERSTPFVFLSSASDSSTVAHGLDVGADDYLLKPIDPQVLRAKLRSILRRRRPGVLSSFRGNLQTFPLPTLMRFCEAQGLTGYIDVFVGDRVLSVRFLGGKVDEATPEETLTTLVTAVASPFVVHSLPVDFAPLTRKRGSIPPPPERPLGRLSSVRLQRRLFQLQTELVGDNPRFVVSVVVIEGRTVWKHTERVPPEATPADVTATIDRLHEEIEGQVEGRMAEEFAARVAASRQTVRQEVDELFDAGFDRFRAQDFAGAVASWEQALKLDPSNAALAVNLKVAREKLVRGE